MMPLFRKLPLFFFAALIFSFGMFLHTARAQKTFTDKAWEFFSPEARDQSGHQRMMNVLRFQGLVDESGHPNMSPQNMPIWEEMYDGAKGARGARWVSNWETQAKSEGWSDQRIASAFWQNMISKQDRNPVAGGVFEHNFKKTLGASSIDDALKTGMSGSTGSRSKIDPSGLKHGNYGDVSIYLGQRGIDVLNNEARRGLALGTEAYIRSLDKIFGSAEWVEKMEALAKKGKEFYDDPTGYLSSALRSDVEKKLSEELEKKLKNTIGKKRYDELMEKYKGVGSEYERLTSIMDDLGKMTGDSRFRTIADQLRDHAPDKMVDRLKNELLQQGKDLLGPGKKEKEAESDITRIERVIAAGKQPPPDLGSYRRFGDLTTNEVQSLLHCLCVASLGASPQVAAGYNLTIPKDADPKRHSCGSLANGPCMAQGWGCWRSFIDFSSEQASNCLKSAGLDPNDKNNMYQLDKFNQAVEEKLTLTLETDTTEICRGESFSVTLNTTGGRPPYYTRIASTTLHRDPRKLQELTNEKQLEIIRWEHKGDYHVGNIWKQQHTHDVFVPHHSGDGFYMDVIAAVYTPGPHQQGLRDESSCMKYVTHRVRVKPDSECREDEEPGTKAPPGITTPIVPPRRPPVTTTPPSAPPERPRDSVDVPPATERPPVRPPRDETQVEDEEDQVQDDPGQTDKPKDKKKDKREGPSVTVDTPTPPGKTATDPDKKDTRKPTDSDHDCLVRSGGYSEGDGPATIFGEVPPGQRVRLTIIGSDGFRQVSEGVERATISRPLNPNGSDRILIENLDVPKCSEEIQQVYGPDGAPIMEGAPELSDAEPTLPEVKQPIKKPGLLDNYSDTLTDDSRRRANSGYSTMHVDSQMQDAARAGNQQLRDAQAIREAATRDAGAMTDDARRKRTQAERDSSWGKALGDALADGIQQGAEAFGKTMGASAADKAISQIFDGKQRPDPGGESGSEASTPTSVESSAPPKPSTEHVSGPKKPVTEPTRPPAGKKKKRPPPGQPKQPMETASCQNCGYSAHYPAGQIPSHCPQCGLGPGMDHLECGKCGFKGFVPSTGGPPSCPKCAAGGAYQTSK